MRVIKALWYRNIKTFVRNKPQLIITIIMPFFFLYIFNSIFKIQGIENSLSYMLAGIVITNVLQISLNISSATITDIVSGFMKEVLVSPVKRYEIAVGQLLAATTISTFQGMIVIIIGLFIGVTFTSIMTPIAVVGAMSLVGITFSAVGLFLASIVKNSQTFQVLEMAITMPLSFLSGAYIPISMLPNILRVVAYFNPMTYATAFFRAVLLEKTSLSTEELISQELAFEFGDFVIKPSMGAFIIVIIGIIFLVMSTWVFARVDFSKMSRSKASEGDIWA